MKRTITLALAVTAFISRAQYTEDFETFTLSPNSAYSSTASVPFQGNSAVFEYKWDTQFSFWSGGFAYTNKYDSSTAGAGNLYGVRPYKGYNNSNIYTVGQDKGVIKVKPPYYIISGFYVTNTTYAYKSMKHGDQFAKKFGGNSGNDSDFFKITVKAFSGGLMKNDSVEFYLADFRFQNNQLDYIVDTWQYVSTGNLGIVDSIKVFMYSSDNSQFGMNTPAFFAIDNVQSTYVNGFAQQSSPSSLEPFPNPFSEEITFSGAEKNALISIRDVCGKEVFTTVFSTERLTLNLSHLNPGLYVAEITGGGQKIQRKIVKQ